MPDSISPFDRPLTHKSFFNIVYFSLISLSKIIYPVLYKYRKQATTSVSGGGGGGGGGGKKNSGGGKSGGKSGGGGGGGGSDSSQGKLAM